MMGWGSGSSGPFLGGLTGSGGVFVLNGKTAISGSVASADPVYGLHSITIYK